MTIFGTKRLFIGGVVNGMFFAKTRHSVFNEFISERKSDQSIENYPLE